MSQHDLFPRVAAYVAQRVSEFDRIDADRKHDLRALADYLAHAQRAQQPARLLFVCTHNSRRSHFGQAWAKVAATYYGVTGVETYSGGTEVTACHPNAIAALARAGLAIHPPTEGANPRYRIAYAEGRLPVDCYSKTIASPENPRDAFCAVMMCAEADAACPSLPGADARLPLPYSDPKVADGTPEESAAYDDRCAQIAREMAFAFSLVRP